jgi:hypothetical protein
VPTQRDLLRHRQPNPHLGHTLPVVLGCTAAPGNCTGRLHLTIAELPGVDVKRISRPQRFSIPAGHRRRYHVKLTSRGYRELRRAANRATGMLVLP